MCRLCAVLSDEAVLLADFLLRPRMSLVRQSYAAQERQALPQGVLPSMAYQQPFLNADGFGVGWYSPKDADNSISENGSFAPCVFTSLKPAWNDPNLRNLSEEVRSPLVLAHIRAAGPSLPVNEASCHPFKAGRLLFAHNGMVGDFARVRRELLAGLSEYGFSRAVEHACIDSAVAFGAFLTELGIKDNTDALRERTADELCSALHRTIDRLVTAVGGRDESLLNFIVCDGQRMIACRFATAPCAGGLDDTADEMQPLGATLYLSAGSRWVASADDPQTYRMRKGADIKCCTAILSSEPLTPIREEWLPIAPNSLVICGIRKEQVNNIDILMFPLRPGPTAPLAALLGVESSASSAARKVKALPAPQMSDTESATKDSETLWMSITGHTEDVNCMTSLFDGRIIAAGSMGGSFRLFDTESGKTIVERKHSDHSGPILALLYLKAPVLKSDGTVLSPRSGGSRSPSPEARRNPTISDNDIDPLSDDVTSKTACGHLLLSASNNELRVWQVNSCSNWNGVGSPKVPCLFCFRFAPNQGQLLSIAGSSIDSVFIGFQSTRIFRVKIWEGWKYLLTCKSRSRSTRYFTCNVDWQPSPTGNCTICTPKGTRAWTDDAPKDVPQPAATDATRNRMTNGTNKFCQHALLKPLHGKGEGHVGFVHSLAYDARTETLASAGGDGRVIFWGKTGQRAAFPHGGAVLAVVGRPSTGEFFSADASGRIRVWDCATVEKGSRAVLTAGNHAAILSLTVVETRCSSGLLLSGDAEGLIRFWDTGRSAVLQQVHSGMNCCAALCLLDVDFGTRGQENWFVRVACGGCSSGTIHMGEITIAADTDGAITDDAVESAPCIAAMTQPADLRHLVVLLKTFVGMHTISGNPAFSDELQKGAAWTASQLEQLLGCTVRISDRCVIARCGWDEKKPLVALYSHYDVVEPGRGWDTDPWKLTAKDGYLYGRGVTDNKGPLLAQVFAVRRLLRRAEVWKGDEAAGNDFVMSVDGTRKSCSDRNGLNSGCPVNVLFIVDGGEEICDVDSVRKAVREAKADGWLRGGVSGLIVNNSSWVDDEHPCLCYGMRGVIDLKVRVLGADKALHSGVHGGLVPEPMFDLMALCSSLVDPAASPCVPGFHDGVTFPCEEDVQRMHAVADVANAGRFRDSFGCCNAARLPAWLEERKESAQEALRRTWFAPALSITAVGQGRLNPSGRHIANEVSCVISARTVPCQRQEVVIDALRRHLDHEFEKRRSTNRLEVELMSSCDWWQSKTTSRIYRAAQSAIAEAWGIDESAVLAIREGGTMAVLGALEAELGCESIQMPLVPATSNAHLANERLAMKVMSRAVDSIAYSLKRVGAAVRGGSCPASLDAVLT